MVPGIQLGLSVWGQADFEPSHQPYILKQSHRLDLDFITGLVWAPCSLPSGAACRLHTDPALCGFWRIPSPVPLLPGPMLYLLSLLYSSTPGFWGLFCFLLVFVFQDRVSLCSPACPGTHAFRLPLPYHPALGCPIPDYCVCHSTQLGAKARVYLEILPYS